MPARRNNRTPVTQKQAHTGRHVQGEKTEAIQAEIARNPNLSARQIAARLHRRGMNVSLSHIYRQLSNSLRRTTERGHPWKGSSIGMPAPAGASVPQVKDYLESDKEASGQQRTKEQLAAIEAVGEVLDKGRRAQPTAQRLSTKRGLNRTRS